MTPADWALVRAQFELLCDLPDDEQQSALQRLHWQPELLAQLQALLSGDVADRIREDALAQAPQLVGRFAADELIGASLGQYRIEALIGAGGMGRVYRAYREDGRYQSQVAIKFVSDGGSAQGFQRERELLALLEHPGIARLLDAGENSAGRPYLVMELVDGLPINEHCVQYEVAGTACIRLIVEAAQAIAYAHERLVLHRDLKPENLLVTRNGQLKILDFGIAKFLDGVDSVSAQTTARFFTLRYAAPEQIFGGVVSTATDVYALAVVLYELMSGQHPYLPGDMASANLAERLLTTEPIGLRRALHQAGRSVRMRNSQLRDLEAVLHRALVRGAAMAYGTAKAFADDLQCIVDDRPVSVRRLGAGELTWRWLRRHRLAAAAIMVAAAGIAAGLALAFWQAGIARDERDLALREAERAERMARFLTEMFEAPRPTHSRGESLQASDLLERGRARLVDELRDEPLMRAKLQATIAETYRALGMYEDSDALLQEAIATARTLPVADRTPFQARLLLQEGQLRSFESRWVEADAQLKRSIAMAREGSLDAVLASALQARSIVLINLQRPDAAAKTAAEAIAVLRRQPRPDAEAIASAEHMLATVAFARDDLPGALAAYQRIVNSTRALHGKDEASLMTSLNNLAAIQMRLDQAQTAEENYREAARVSALNFGENHRDQALPLLGLGVALRVQGRLEESLAKLALAQKMYEDWEGTSHPSTAYARLLHAETLWLAGRNDDAINALADADQVLLDRNGPEHVYSCRSALLRILLRSAAPQQIAGEQLATITPCLSQSSTPGNVRLLAQWAQARQVILEDPRKAAELKSSLLAQSQSLTPKDALLSAAVEVWAGAQ